MFIFGNKFRQLSYGYEDPFEISSHEHRLAWKKCTKTLHFKNGNFYYSNIVCASTNDFFSLLGKNCVQFSYGFKNQIIKSGNIYGS